MSNVVTHEVNFDEVHRLSVFILESLQEEMEEGMDATAGAAVALTFLRLASPRTLRIEEEIEGTKAIMEYAVALCGGSVKGTVTH